MGRRWYALVLVVALVSTFAPAPAQADGDPMALFRPIDLAEIVHLAPTTDRPRPQPSTDERRGLLAGLVHGAGAAINSGGHLVLGAANAAERSLVARFPVPLAAVAGT